MSKKHKQLVDAAKKAIDNILSDTSVPRDQTIESLRELIDEINGLIENL